jgi:methylenetetrahydrofolate dehydrogenase (NADP+) / methenyltetrahydrofolate cyclohydrolase
MTPNKTLVLYIFMDRDYVKIHSMQLLLAEPIIKEFWLTFKANETSKSTLAIILVGDNLASQTYVALKQRKGKEYGINVQVERFAHDVTQQEIQQKIIELNSNPAIGGIIAQLPLPDSLNTDLITQSIDPKKDVDNLTDKNNFISPMVQAAEALVKHYDLDLAHKKICIVGYGRLVGKPLEGWLTELGITPQIVDKDTENGDKIIHESDVIFAGTGVDNRINTANTREGQIVFDCSGVDVDFEAVKVTSKAITPPKGAIGPLTVHFLFNNLLQMSEKHS